MESLSFLRKVPGKSRADFGGSLEPLTQSKISFWGREDAPLPRLTQSDILNTFQTLREEFTSFLKLSEILELILSFLPERDANKMAYVLLLRYAARHCGETERYAPDDRLSK